MNRKTTEIATATTTTIYNENYYYSVLWFFIVSETDRQSIVDVLVGNGRPAKTAVMVSSKKLRN